jgi:hypothetical protein
VWQAFCCDWQLLLSLPLTPSTYHVLLARAAGARAKNKRLNSRLSFKILASPRSDRLVCGAHLVTNPEVGQPEGFCIGVAAHE